jgi:hypothetical protein
MAELRVDIASEFIGRKAFFEANKATSALEKSVKGLGRTLGLALGGAAIVSYGKAAVKAFSADEAAARRLASAVDNLGLSFSQARVTTFIADLEKSSNIADDVLRPAFQALLTTTGSLTKSQELLNNAIQISRASGIDLATVSQDLASGYVGITRGLKKYNTGLTQAELKSKSFADILGIMLVRSAGAAQDYLTTTSYKLDALSLAGNNAKETIGAGLVDAFARLAGGSSTADAVKAIDNIAKAINGVTLAIATVIGGFAKLYKGLDFLTSFGGLTGVNGKLFQKAAPSTNRSASPAGTAARTAQQRAAEAAAAKRAKELAALTTKQVKAQKDLTAEQKKQALLKKAGSIFDLEQIGLIAALKGQLSDEDRKRVLLQLALLTGNTSEAQKLTYEIAKAQGLGEHLANYLASLPDAKNPFASWAAYLDMLAEKARAIVTGTGSMGGMVGGQTVIPTPAIPSTNVPDSIMSSNSGNGGFTPGTSTYAAPPQVNVYVNGSVVTEQELISAVSAGIQKSSLSGSPSQIGRILGMFGTYT